MPIYTQASAPYTPNYSGATTAQVEYDDAAISYDDSAISYDGINPLQYTQASSAYTPNYTKISNPQ